MLGQGPMGSLTYPTCPAANALEGSPWQGYGEGGKWPRSRDTWPALGTGGVRLVCFPAQAGWGGVRDLIII